MTGEIRGEELRPIAEFPNSALEWVRELVQVLGEVKGYGEFRAAFLSQVDCLSANLCGETLARLRSEARKLGADAVFLGRYAQNDGFVTGNSEWEGIAARYNEGVTRDHLQRRLELSGR